MDDTDLRFNRPVEMEWLRGELLYRQMREGPLTYLPLPDDAFCRENEGECLRQAWTALLSPDEAAAVACYGRRESRWLDVCRDEAAPILGAAQTAEVDRLRGNLLSAVSKSLTFGLLLRHYMRAPLPVLEGEIPLRGRVYVLKGFMSCALRDRSADGYGRTELRIAAGPGAGKGLFVSDDEFVLPPGTTLRMLGTRGNVTFAEAVRTLRTSWAGVQADNSHGYAEDTEASEANNVLIGKMSGRCALRTAPAPTMGW